MIQIDRVAEATKPPVDPMYSPWGYVIAPDGTTYALLYQWYHGVALALLNPEALKAYRDHAGEPLSIPGDRDDINVFDFQHFELKTHNQLPFIRVCPERFTGPPSIDLGMGPVTPEQKEALRLIAKGHGWQLADEICMDHRDITLKELWKHLNDDTPLT